MASRVHGLRFSRTGLELWYFTVFTVALWDLYTDVKCSINKMHYYYYINECMNSLPLESIDSSMHGIDHWLACTVTGDTSTSNPFLYNFHIKLKWTHDLKMTLMLKIVIH